LPGLKPRGVSVESAFHPRNRIRGRQSRKRRRKTGSPSASQMQTEADRGRPVVENRLFKPRLTIKTRRHPVARLRHRSCDPRIARLVRTNQPNCSELPEETHHDYHGGGEKICYLRNAVVFFWGIQNESSLTPVQRASLRKPDRRPLKICCHQKSLRCRQRKQSRKFSCRSGPPARA
jgi:hypothetical protein